MKKIVIIDGQGGGRGRQLIGAIKAAHPELTLTAVGTNAIATAAMIKAGADRAATGENAVIVASRTADVIIGPIGVVIADALLGEITPAMAVAVGQSAAEKLLLPVNTCANVVVGVAETGVGALARRTIELLEGLL